MISSILIGVLIFAVIALTCCLVNVHGHICSVAADVRDMRKGSRNDDEALWTRIGMLERHLKVFYREPCMTPHYVSLTSEEFRQ